MGVRWRTRKEARGIMLLFGVAVVWFIFWIRGGWIAAVLGAIGMLELAHSAAPPGPTEIGWLVVLVLPWIPALIRTSVTKQIHA